MRTAVFLAWCLIVVSAAFGAEEEASFLNRSIPDVPIRLSEGRSDSLRQYCRRQPTLIAFAYSRCAGICYPFLYVLRDVAPTDNEWRSNVRILVLSFDRRETPASMRAMAATVGKEKDPQWRFGIIEPESVPALARAVGFDYRVDSASGQIDHPPMIVGVNGEGTIVRVVKNYNLTRTELQQMTLDMQGGFVPFYKDNINTLITCFTYNAATGTYSISWGMLLLYAPAAIGTVVVWRVFAGKRKRARAAH